MFIDIYIGWPGSVHAARVFSNSAIFQQGQSGTLFPDHTKTINNISVPIMILGDPAYPLLKWVMKPLRCNGRLRSQVCFNCPLSMACIVSENAFGRLKGRWRCLLTRLDTNVTYVPDVIAAYASVNKFVRCIRIPLIMIG